jgi:Leucine-rich repeat (LRR) protein
MEDLETFNISFNEFGKLPEELIFLRSLKVLHADAVGATFIPASFQQLKLRSLSFSTNHIQDFPFEVANAWSEVLEELRLASSNLQAIPPAIFKLKRLR